MPPTVWAGAVMHSSFNAAAKSGLSARSNACASFVPSLHAYRWILANVIQRVLAQLAQPHSVLPHPIQLHDLQPVMSHRRLNGS